MTQAWIVEGSEWGILAESKAGFDTNVTNRLALRIGKEEGQDSIRVGVQKKF